MSAFSRTDRSILGSWWWTVDRVLLAGFGVLALVGVIMIFTASPPVAARLYGSEMRLVHKHLMFLVPAIFLMVGASTLAPRGVLRLATGMLFLFGLLLLGTLFFGAAAKGATRWINVLGAPLQPSEFVKPALAVTTAWFLSSRPGLKGIGRAAIPVGIAIMLLMLQPDVGMSAVILMVFAIQLFLAGIALGWVVLVLGGGIAGAGLAYLFYPHFSTRVDGFLDPDSQGFQVEQSLRAITNGGIFGRGPGEGIAKFHLPDAHADFIFAATAEEFGLIACLLLLALFLFMLTRGLYRVHQSDDRFCQLAACGLIAQFGLQAVINMAVNLNMMPTKGMTLPFMSYGGSSLLALALGMGMLLALTRRNARLSLRP